MWKAKFEVLKENLLHHIKEEEEEIFPKARKNFGHKKLMDMGDTMMRMKKEAEA